MPVRRLHNYLYCPRLFYLQWVEDLFVESADTASGSAVHKRVDDPSHLREQNLDICHPKRLRQVAKTCESFGQRLQYSVFECPLDDLRFEKLRSALDEIIKHDDDQILFVSRGPEGSNQIFRIETLGLPYSERPRGTII